ncbi:hypothetical protein DKX38_011101 [Salix brachista]|uniref:Uncharacterized protein n=1 Tax=Salix brachista TaxID=2182728 RepID=A0A5N5LXV2_9ROSI|nr:hypothetical protein DKX38_011101 [Salix brachista]
MASLFPSGNSSLRSCLFLVLHVLPVTVSPYVSYLFHNFEVSQAGFFPARQQFYTDLHVLSMARILSILPSPGDSISNLGVLHCLRLQILDCGWFALRVFSFCGELPDCAAGMQLLNGAILFLFLNFHVKMYLGKRKEVIREAMVEAEMMKVK